MTADLISTRLAKIKKYIKEQGLNALFVANQANVTYLTGFSGLAPDEREAFLFITSKSARLLTFSTYFGLYKKGGNDFTTSLITFDKKLSDHLLEIIQQERIKTVGFEEKNLTYFELGSLKGKIKQVKWQKTMNIVENLRLIKDTNELNYIEKAAKISDQAFSFIKRKIKIGISEKQLAFEIEFFIKRQADNIAFSPIVAFDNNSAIPHHLPSKSQKLAVGSIILLDFGAKVNNYCSDMTRVIFFGSPKPEQIKIYNTVLEAQTRAYNKLRAGSKGNEIDKIAREYMLSQGYPEYSHGLGHGVGLTIHEDPRLKKGNNQTLPKNSVVTLEPAIYLEGKFGIRIEDLVVLKKDRAEVLSKSPKNITIL